MKMRLFAILTVLVLAAAALIPAAVAEDNSVPDSAGYY